MTTDTITHGRTAATRNNLSESADTYPHVLAVLNDRWRVVQCKARLQWILQHRLGSTERAAGSDWRGRSFCRTADALIRSCSHYVEDIDQSARAILAALPPIKEASS